MVLPWRSLASRLLIDNHWIRVRADRCQTAEGLIIDPYYVVESRDFVAAVVLTESQEIVLVRQYRHGLGAVTLELPAGILDEGEEPVSGCLREVREETGYEGKSARLLRTWSPNPQRYANRTHVVLVQEARLVSEARDDPAERIETALWPLAAAWQLLHQPEFVDATQVGALALALHALENG